MKSVPRLRFAVRALLVVPVAVALSQFYFVQFSDLTRWKGGGFGMYTDPHPTKRSVWLEGNRDGSSAAVRLDPLDARMCVSCIDDPMLRSELRVFQRLAERIRNFPGLWGSCTLGSVVREWLADSEESAAERYFPTSDLQIVVVEVELLSDFEAIDATLISRRPLCVPPST